MKLSQLVSAMIIGLGLNTTACAAPPSEPSVQASTQTSFDGKWKNQMGSGMALKVDDGVVSGQYYTNVGAPDSGKKFNIVGQVEGDQIIFFVNFKGFNSMTAWVGQLTIRDDQKILRTQWHNTKDIPDNKERDEIWASIRTGSSDFVRVATP